MNVYYQGGALAGLTSSMRCLVPMTDEESALLMAPDRPNLAYWRRLTHGVTISLDGRDERLTIGSCWTGSMSPSSVVEWAEGGAPTTDHQVQARLAVDAMKRCDGVIVIANSQSPYLLEYVVEDLRADFLRVGRRFEGIPIVLQANFQDIPTAASPAALGALVGVPAHLCVPSVANKCIGVREALSLLLREIRSRSEA